MRDDDRMLDLPAEFGSGIVGVCDICGTRQAVIVLQKERYKLCVIDFLNKTWLKTDKKPGTPVPAYRSERVWFETHAVAQGRAPAIVLTPTKVVKHPIVLITPDVFGITTTVLDGAIRFAREGYEVLVPDLGKTDGIGATHHLALRTGAQFRGGVSLRSRKVVGLLNLYTDAFEYLRGREMVDAGKSAVFGASYGASLALELAAQETGLAAVVLAYPQPVSPPDLGKLVTAPLLVVTGSRDRAGQRARQQLEAVRRSHPIALEALEIPGARHGFLGRDLAGYDLPLAEAAWTKILEFLKQQLMPAPPRPTPPPLVKPAPSANPPAVASAPAGTPPASGSAPSGPALGAPVPPAARSG